MLTTVDRAEDWDTYVSNLVDIGSVPDGTGVVEVPPGVAGIPGARVDAFGQ